MITTAWIIVAAMGIVSVTLGARDLYRYIRDTNQRIEIDLEELRAIYEPIDYWPVHDGRIVEILEPEWGQLTAYRAVWPIAAGSPE